MKLIKKLSLYLLYLICFFISLSLISYSLLIYRPSTVTKILDTFFILDYSLEIQSVSSNHSFLKPEFSFEKIQIFNLNQDEIISIPNIKFGINIISSLSSGYFNLSLLEIDSFQSKNTKSNKTSESIFIKGNNLKINNQNLQISSEYFEIVINNLNSKILFANGFINSYPYSKINVFLDSRLDNIYYSSDHFFDEYSLEKNNLFDLSSFKDSKINLNLKTKGIFNFTTNKSERFDKFYFNNSMLENESGFKTDGITANLYSGIDKSIHGLFSASIPDQNINGTISYSQKDNLRIRSNLLIDMSNIIPSNQYLAPIGNEFFKIIMTIKQKQTSMELYTDFTNTIFKSSLDDLKKPINEILETSISIEDMSQASYLIKNKKFHSFVDKNNNGFFAFGDVFNSEIQLKEFKDGFYIFLDLKELNLDNILYAQSDIEEESSIKQIRIKAQEFNFLNNLYLNQSIDIFFNEEIAAILSGNDLNGNINIDKTNFIKINLNKTKFNFKGLDIAQSNLASDLSTISLRFIGKDIQTEDELFQDIDFYLLKNKNILTIDNIKIDSQRLKISPNIKNEKAYISYNNISDLYKLRGAYKIDNSSGYFNNILNYDFNLLETDLNIQWNSLSSLTNLEGRLNFLVKDLNINREIPDSTLLRALKILNLNAIVDGVEESQDNKLFINRADGNIIIGKKRALISAPIKIETTEASMRWNGEILKNSKGELSNLNLDLSMRLKISENIPWYAAIFGGMPALAGGVVLENIFEDAIEDASTINFKMKGTVDDPNLIRLN